jgi:hypothetical protein
MLKGLSAILVAAVCAGVVVGFVPPPEPAAAAATPRANPRIEQNAAAINTAPVVAAASACTQTWPYYEQSCLRDSRQLGRGAPTARVIPSSYPVKAQTSKPVSKPVSKIAKLAGGSR